MWICLWVQGRSSRRDEAPKSQWWRVGKWNSNCLKQRDVLESQKTKKPSQLCSCGVRHPNLEKVAEAAGALAGWPLGSCLGLWSLACDACGLGLSSLLGSGCPSLVFRQHEGWVRAECKVSLTQQPEGGPEQGENRTEMLQLGWTDWELCECGLHKKPRREDLSERTWRGMAVIWTAERL